MKSQQNSKTKNKRIYEKPQLRIVGLETGQVLILGCKMASGGSAPTDPVTCVGLSCSVEGS